MLDPPGVVIWSGDEVGTLANVANEVKHVNAMIDASNAPQYGISHDEH
jgi:hypothetical protein